MVVETRGATAVVFQVARDGYYVEDFVFIFISTFSVLDAAYYRSQSQYRGDGNRSDA